MPRPVILFTNGWTDLPFEEVVSRAADWGYQGLELAAWGDHLEVQRALSESDYCSQRLALLGRYDLQIPVVSTHRIGQAVCDPIDERHQPLLPDYVWGDGEPEGVRQRATEEMMASIRVARKLGATVVSGFTGSPIWSYIAGYPHPRPEVVVNGFRAVAKRWNPILDVCRDCGVRFAFEVHPGEIAFDLYSAELMIDAFKGREELGFTFDPSHFFWQGIDPVEFLYQFPDRIYHVHMKDVAFTLDGRSGILTNIWPVGDKRRGWHYRSPGHGGIDWEGLIRGLNSINYQGPLSVEFSDPQMDREYGADDACKFVKRLDFDRKPPK
jgi:sugar phosphate isomerase/epimerase